MPAPEGTGSGGEKVIRQIERLVCRESDGSPVDLLRCADPAATRRVLCGCMADAQAELLYMHLSKLTRISLESHHLPQEGVEGG